MRSGKGLFGNLLGARDKAESSINQLDSSDTRQQQRQERKAAIFGLFHFKVSERGNG